MKVDAYLNLNRDCISIRSRESEDYGTVVAHRPRLTVVNAEFVVQPAGRERVRETGVKNVHAFVRGEWDDSVKVMDGEKVTYNPYEYDSFVHAESEEPVARAEATNVTKKGVYARELEYDRL